METEILLTHEPIRLPALDLPSREIGASLEFLGIVRETENDCALTGLFYEAYETMALQTLEKMFAHLAPDFACKKVIFIHRLGFVPVGEASLFLRVLSAHRGPAIALLSRAIDLLKSDVPIWKSVPRKSTAPA